MLARCCAIGMYRGGVFHALIGPPSVFPERAATLWPSAPAVDTPAQFNSQVTCGVCELPVVQYLPEHLLDSFRDESESQRCAAQHPGCG